MGNLIDLTGQKFGRLTVLGRDTSPYAGKSDVVRWICQCSCENKTIITAFGNGLRSGHTTSCGCFHKEQVEKAGKSRAKWKTPDERRLVEVIFNGMHERCYCPNHIEYHRYGGRGIGICQEWLDDRRKFVDWALANGYHDPLTIERKDNDGPYSPENCTWISRRDQYNNRSTSRHVEIDGVTMTLKDWVALTELPYSSMQFWLNTNFPKFVEKVIDSPRAQQMFAEREQSNVSN